MVKKRSPKDVIEKADPKIEHLYIKFGGEPLVHVGLNMSSDSVDFDYQKIGKEYGARKRQYTIVHNHPYNPSRFKDRKITEASPLPSPHDLKAFLKDDNAKTMMIAQQNNETGNVDGYFILKKTKRTNRFGGSPADNLGEIRQSYFSDGILSGIKKLGNQFVNSHRINKLAHKYGKVKFYAAMLDEPEYLSGAMKKISEKYGLQYRLLPSEGYQTDNAQTHFIRKEDKTSGLEGKVTGIITLAGLAAGIFFLLSFFQTSNVLASPGSSINWKLWTGLSLLLLGLVAGFFYFKNKK